MNRKILIKNTKQGETYISINTNIKNTCYTLYKNDIQKKSSFNKYSFEDFLQKNKIPKKYIEEFKKVLDFKEFIEYMGIEKEEYKTENLNNLYIEFFETIKKYPLTEYKIILKNDFNIYVDSVGKEKNADTENFIIYK